MNKLLIFIFIICFIFAVKLIIEYNEVKYIRSDIDNQMYLIRQANGKTENYLKSSANTLSHINKKINSLIDHLDKKYPNEQFVRKLKENYNSTIISEAAYDQRYTTFMVNKKEMHICLRTRDHKQELYDTNLLMYVIIHELAHMCNYDKNNNPINGHGQEFKNIFKILVQEAMSIGVYQYIDFKNTPKEYCGIVINTSIVNK